MRSHWLKSISFAAAALLAGTHICVAKDWVVNVGGSQDYGGGYGGGYTTPILSFNPANLTITAGDTVTFRNLGGAMHNVHADDDSFRCANGCDDNGGSGNIDDSNWSFSRTFNSAGVVNYHCDEHVSMGMVGKITVKPAAVATGLPISQTTSGSWYNPQQSGHGFLLQVIPPNTLLAYWFVYTPDGAAQAWIVGVGAFDSASNTVTLEGFQDNGAKFPPNFNATDVTPTDWGSMTFTFTDCNNGQFSWTSKLAAYGTGTMPIVKIAENAGLHCGP